MHKGWDVMCNIDRVAYDATNRNGYLFVPEDNYPDMASTIKCFTSMDPECCVIRTFVGGKEDTVYVKNPAVEHLSLEENWEAFNASTTS